MAYPVSPETPRTRPTVVTAAVYLLYLAALLEAVSGIAAFLGYGPTKRAYEEALAGTTAANTAGTFAVFSLVAGVLALIIAVLILVLAIVDARGSNVGRIITWVFGALTLCCVGGFLALNQAGNAMNNGSSSTNGGVDPKKLQEAVAAALPSWYKPVTTAAGILFVLALLSALILLALPAANAFFSKRAQQVWEPPLPPPAPPAPPAAI